MHMGVGKVHFVYPNKMLMMREVDEFSDYWRLSDCENRISYHCSLDFRHRQGDLILIDEADAFLLQEPGKAAM